MDGSGKPTGEAPVDLFAGMGEQLGTNHRPTCRAVAIAVAALIVASECERGKGELDSMAYGLQGMEKGRLSGMGTRLLRDGIVACTCDNRRTVDEVLVALGVVGPALKDA